MTTIFSDPGYEYLELRRHWHAGSEKYAGADAFVTAITQGWKVDGDIYLEEHWHAGSRLVVVFHVELVSGDERMTMPVLSNPYMRRVMRRLATKVRPIEERDSIRNRQHNNGTRS